MGQHTEVIQKAMESIKQAQASVNKDYWRLQYHVVTPAYWMNDPNGFSFYKGEYHLFYQHHPYSAEWGPMHWGHVKSKNLASWEHLPIALAPSKEYDRDGCFSGSAIEKDGKLLLMYTGHKWTGNDRDEELEQVQCIAVSEDGIKFEKYHDNPVIASAPEGDIHPFHFRDPKVWKHENDYYCVIGSRTKNHQGQVLLYRSKDLYHWEFINVAAKGEEGFSFMWECPDIFQLDGQDVLMMSPQGVKPKGYLYQNLHQSGYVIGKLDYESGLLKHGEFELLDYGFDFYAPQTTQDDQGRRIMIAWMAMWENEMPEQQNDWAGAMTIPRELKIHNGKIISQPVKELSELRENEIVYENISVHGIKELTGINGDCFELELQIDLKEASTFGLKVRMNQSTGEETVLSYNRQDGFFIFDRENSGKGPGGVRKMPVELNNGKLHLQLFMDRSSVELFVNRGEQVMSGRIYPDKNSSGIQFFSDKEVELLKVNHWNLKKGI